jgi:hypothetical protein
VAPVSLHNNADQDVPTKLRAVATAAIDIDSMVNGVTQHFLNTERTAIMQPLYSNHTSAAKTCRMPMFDSAG